MVLQVGGGGSKAPRCSSVWETREGSSSPERGLASRSTWEFEFWFLKVCWVGMSLWRQNASRAQGVAEPQDLACRRHRHQRGARLRALGGDCGADPAPVRREVRWAPRGLRGGTKAFWRLGVGVGGGGLARLHYQRGGPAWRIFL